jgi:hypothetical protein
VFKVLLAPQELKVYKDPLVTLDRKVCRVYRVPREHKVYKAQ